jgi:two-component system NtrC family sensor kinase
MHLEERVDIRAPGELRELATSFNDMRERLHQALGEINRFTHELEEKVEERSRQLTAAQAKLIQSDRLASLGQLSASVAHEINNPISGVLNLSMLLQRMLRNGSIPPERAEEFQRYLTQISEETARVGRIVKDLLAFSRRPAPQNSQADLNLLLRNTISLLSHKLELGNVRVRLDVDESLPSITCDSAQMQQVIINLVMNAAEAMPAGGEVVVRTRLMTDSDEVLIEVSDQGGGIPQAIRPRIFDPFFTTKEEGKGVGLGLSVVYGIVEAHGGSIDVRSHEGAGTTFIVCLPVSRPEAGERGAAWSALDRGRSPESPKTLGESETRRNA